MKKKLISILLAIAFCLSLPTPSAFAISPSPVFNSAERLKTSCPLKEKCINTLGITSEEYGNLVDGLYDAVMNFEEYYILRPYNIPITEDCLYAIGEIVGEFGEAFYVTGNFSYSSMNDENYLYAVFFEYAHDKKEVAAMKEEIEEKVDLFIGDLIGSHIPEYQKILLVHDRIIAACRYDDYNVEYHPDNIPSDDFCIYGVMVNNIAVCEGYSRTFTYLLSYLGIRSYNCLSYELNHMWNIVYVDGELYHTDVTFDDPLIDIAGKVSHTYLLISTNKMISLRGNADYYQSPVSQKYESFFWHDSMTEICMIDGCLYYFDTNNNKIMKLTENGPVLLFKPEDVRWRADATSAWKGNHARMSSDKKYLYYSTPEYIMRLDVKTAAAQQFYRPAVSGHDEFLVYGFTVLGNYFVIDMFNSPNFQTDTKELYEYRYKFADEHRVGDLNCDGKVNVSDSSLIRTVIVGKNTDEQIIKYADINGDGKVNVSDTLLLKKIITGKVVM